jgi:hypothetical protein
MAMIEIQDLVTPLKSKTNLVSMVLAVGLFMVYRITGGGLSWDESRSYRGNSGDSFVSIDSFEQEDESDIERRLGRTAAPQRQLGRSPQATRKSDSKGIRGSMSEDFVDFDPLRGTDEEKGIAESSQRRRVADSDEGGFADIERELGLR